MYGLEKINFVPAKVEMEQEAAEAPKKRGRKKAADIDEDDED